MQELISLAERNEGVLLWVSGGSLAMFVGSLLLVPVLVARAPSDFFVRPPRARRGALAVLLKIGRNLLGLVLLVMGLLMLVLPGQGLLMILLSITLLDVPAKRALLRRMVQKKPVWRALAYLRDRANQPPFERP